MKFQSLRNLFTQIYNRHEFSIDKNSWPCYIFPKKVWEILDFHEWGCTRKDFFVQSISMSLKIKKNHIKILSSTWPDEVFPLCLGKSSIEIGVSLQNWIFLLFQSEVFSESSKTEPRGWNLVISGYFTTRSSWTLKLATDFGKYSLRIFFVISKFSVVCPLSDIAAK